MCETVASDVMNRIHRNASHDNMHIKSQTPIRALTRRVVTVGGDCPINLELFVPVIGSHVKLAIDIEPADDVVGRWGIKIRCRWKRKGTTDAKDKTHKAQHLESGIQDRYNLYKRLKNFNFLTTQKQYTPLRNKKSE